MTWITSRHNSVNHPSRKLFSLNDQVCGKAGNLEFFQDGTDCRIGDIGCVKFDENEVFKFVNDHRILESALFHGNAILTPSGPEIQQDRFLFPSRATQRLFQQPDVYCRIFRFGTADFISQIGIIGQIGRTAETMPNANACKCMQMHYQKCKCMQMHQPRARMRLTCANVELYRLYRIILKMRKKNLQKEKKNCIARKGRSFDRNHRIN